MSYLTRSLTKLSIKWSRNQQRTVDQNRTRSSDTAKKLTCCWTTSWNLATAMFWAGDPAARPHAYIKRAALTYRTNGDGDFFLFIVSARSRGPVTSRRVRRLSVAAGSRLHEALTGGPLYPSRGAPGLIRHKLWDRGRRRGPLTHQPGKGGQRLFLSRLDRTVDSSDSARGVV